MKLIPADGSKAIKGHAYDPDTRKLTVQFHKGETYEYEGVPPETYAAFTGAASMGTFHNKRISPVHQGKKVK
jgi:hypothetical protein